jgi:hypothetical protein
VHRVQLLLGAEAAEQRHGAVAVGADLAQVLGISMRMNSRAWA